MLKATLEQWRVFQTVVEEGSFAKAAEKLHKSQSSLSYSLLKLQDVLGATLLEQQGRRAVLTEEGAQVFNLAKQLIRNAKNLERFAQQHHSHYERTLRLAIDQLFPPQLLMQVLKQFALDNTSTRIILFEGILSGPSDLLVQGEADLAIISRIPEGYVGDKLLDSHSIPYAHIDSPLHQKEIDYEDLGEERYIIVQDSGSKHKRNEGWLGSEFHWKVSSMEMKIQCVAQGIGFSWLPKHLVDGRNLPIKPLKLKQEDIRTYPLYIVHPNPQQMGPAAQRLIALFKECSS
jgi:DNA-binding transcriptional LysR family regulator